MGWGRRGRADVTPDGCSAMVEFAVGRYAGVVVFSVRVSQPRSIAGRSWNLAQDVCAVFSLTLIVLRLAGVIAWSWWWVLSPLWISGILLAAVLCALLILVGRDMHSYRRRSRRDGFAVR